MRPFIHICLLLSTILVTAERRPNEQPQLKVDRNAEDRLDILSSLVGTQIVVPVGALVIGTVFYLTGHKSFGLMTVYFGAQSGFNILMKIIFSDVQVSEKLGRHGIPAAFLVTAMQQAVGFVVFCFVFAVRSLTNWRYQPKIVRTWADWASVLCLSLAFALNIGLNNFSLSLLAISMNLIIRACLPLITLIVQILLSHCLPGKNVPKVGFGEVSLLASGVVCAAIAILAKGQGSSTTDETSHLLLGIVVCSCSLLACALNMVFAGFLGTDMNLNAFDTTLYMSVPVTLLLLPAVFLVRHPVGWPGAQEFSDWEVFLQVLESSPSTVGLVVLSGLIAFAYNVLQYTLVQSLSATHTAFAGNFNKAATITLSLFLGLEHLPAGRWGLVMLVAILGNIASFAGYNAVKSKDKPSLPSRPSKTIK